METSLTTRLQAEALAFAIETATQEKPYVSYFADGHAELYFDKEQIPRLQSFVNTLIKKAPGNVRINFAPVLIPVILKKILPVMLLLLAGGYLVGKLK